MDSWVFIVFYSLRSVCQDTNIDLAYKFKFVPGFYEQVFIFGLRFPQHLVCLFLNNMDIEDFVTLTLQPWMIP